MAFVTIDPMRWSRREQFEYFKDYAHPYCNVTTDVDVTALVTWAERNGTSFTLAALHASLSAANEVEPFRYRFRGDDVIVHDRVHARLLVLRPDETLGFCRLDFRLPFDDFVGPAAAAVAEAERTVGFEPRSGEDDVLHYSVTPWMYLTSVTHPRNSNRGSVPKLVFGRYRTVEGRTRMPLSIEVHHALMDGWHMHGFVRLFQERLDDPAVAFTTGSPKG